MSDLAPSNKLEMINSIKLLLHIKVKMGEWLGMLHSEVQPSSGGNKRTASLNRSRAVTVTTKFASRSSVKHGLGRGPKLVIPEDEAFKRAVTDPTHDKKSDGVVKPRAVSETVTAPASIPTPAFIIPEYTGSQMPVDSHLESEAELKQPVEANVRQMLANRVARGRGRGSPRGSPRHLPTFGSVDSTTV